MNRLEIDRQSTVTCARNNINSIKMKVCVCVLNFVLKITWLIVSIFVKIDIKFQSGKKYSWCNFCVDNFSCFIQDFIYVLTLVSYFSVGSLGYDLSSIGNHQSNGYSYSSPQHSLPQYSSPQYSGIGKWQRKVNQACEFLCESWNFKSIKI